MTTASPDVRTPGRALGRCLIVAVAACLVLVILMTVVTALGAPQGDTVVAQVADLARDDTVYRALAAIGYGRGRLRRPA